VDLFQIADSAFQQAKERAGEWISCSSGCDDCCRKPFAITAADARLLQLGIQETGLTDITEKAESAWNVMKSDFPGDADSGVLDVNEEWRAWFFHRHQGLACPVLDESTGACRLYAYRPVCCRLYGPLIEIGGQVSDPCPLCFSGASEIEIQSAKITVDLPEAPAEIKETVIAFALSQQSAQFFQSDLHLPYDEVPEQPE